jgi:hypothetical protein
MAARRLVIVMLVLLFVSTLAAALIPAPDTGDETETTRTTEPTAKPAGRELARSIDAAAKRSATIRIAVGDQLTLTVRSPRPDQVEIARLGQLEDVAPTSPARFDLLPADPGDYAVRLLGAGRVIGRIEVAEAAEKLSESRRGSGRSGS